MPRFKNRTDPWSPLDDLVVLEDGTRLGELVSEIQCINNDVSENILGGKYTAHRTFNTPYKGLLTGTVYIKGEAVQTFMMDKDRKITQFGEPLKPDSPTLMTSGQGFDTGIIVMHWSQPVEPHEVRLVMSYEYNVEDEPHNVIHFSRP